MRLQNALGRILAGTLLVACTLLMPTANADRLQLAGGDEIEGKLLEMSGDTIKFQHPVLGVLTVPRAQIHAIELGDKRGGPRRMADGSEAKPETAEEVIDRLVNPELDPTKVNKLAGKAKQHSQPEDAIEQLRREGVDGKMMSQLHGMLPGFGSPVVQDHFRDRVSGLMNGSLTINDIREEAIDARGQLKELMDDLGPSGQALQGYFGILDGFIKKTDPTKPKQSPDIPPHTPDPIAPL